MYETCDEAVKGISVDREEIFDEEENVDGKEKVIYVVETFAVQEETCTWREETCT